jgi:hypothetical protein
MKYPGRAWNHFDGHLYLTYLGGKSTNVNIEKSRWFHFPDIIGGDYEWL